MTRKDKIAVTLAPGVVESVRRAVRDGRAASVSAYVEEALTLRVQSDDLDALLDEMLARTGGPMTDEERAEIDRMVGW